MDAYKYNIPKYYYTIIILSQMSKSTRICQRET